MKRKKKKSPAPVASERFIDAKDIQHVLVDLELSQAELAAEMGIAQRRCHELLQGNVS